MQPIEGFERGVYALTSIAWLGVAYRTTRPMLTTALLLSVVSIVTTTARNVKL